jgi:hypothetical protein
MGIKDLDQKLETVVRHAVESGYSAKELGIPLERAIEEALEAMRIGKAMGTHRGPTN